MALKLVLKHDENFASNAEPPDEMRSVFEQHHDNYDHAAYEDEGVSMVHRGRDLLQTYSDYPDYLVYRGRSLMQDTDYEVVDMTKEDKSKSLSDYKYLLLLPAGIIGVGVFGFCLYKGCKGGAGGIPCCCCCPCCNQKNLEQDYIPGVTYENGKKVHYEITPEEQEALMDLQNAW